MANLKRMLGTMLATRMGAGGGLAGLAGTALLGGIGGIAGLAAMAYLAYRAYRDRGTKDPVQNDPIPGEHARSASRPTKVRAENGFPNREREAEPIAAGIAGITGVIGSVIDSLSRSRLGDNPRFRCFGDRISDLLDPRPAPEETVGDEKALLLIRAMITAAQSDGPISAAERRRIIAKLDEAGADEEDHSIIESELQNPTPLDMLLREVNDQATARQFYLASLVAIEDATPTQRSYLEYLRQRLKLPQEDVDTAERMASSTDRT